jgi:hypothetical protein
MEWYQWGRLAAGVAGLVFLIVIGVMAFRAWRGN